MGLLLKVRWSDNMRHGPMYVFRGIAVIVLGIIFVCVIGPVALVHSIGEGILMIGIGGIAIVGAITLLYKYYLLSNTPEWQEQQRESDLLNQLIRAADSQGVIELQLLARVTGLSVDATTEKVRELITRGDLDGKITGRIYLPSGNVQEMLSTVVTELKKARLENTSR